MGLVNLQDDVKPWLDIPAINVTSDVVLGDLIESATIFFESYTNRVLEEQDLTHQFNGNGDHRLVLREWPVSQVTSVSIDPTWDFSTLVDNTTYIIDNEVFVVRKTVWDQGVRNVLVAYTAGYAPDDVPADLRQACLHYIEFLWKSRADFRLGVTNRSKNGETMTYQDSIPKNIIDVLDTYKREGAMKDLLRRAGG